MTLTERQEYLEGGFTELSCARCDALVRVRKSSLQQTSVQWTTQAAGRCPRKLSALVPTCPDLRDSIERAVKLGTLGVV